MARGAKPGERRGGRAKGEPNRVNRDLKAAAQKYTIEALTTLVTVMRSGESEVAKVNAADKILDRGHGKAPQAQTGEGGVGPIALAISWLPPSA